MRVKEVYIWGAGLHCGTVFQSLRMERCRLLGVVDSDTKRQGQDWKEGIKIHSPKELLRHKFDYVVISPKNAAPIVQQCMDMGVGQDKVVVFWGQGQAYDFIDGNVPQIYNLKLEVKKYQRRWENAPYELGVAPSPTVKPANELLEYLLKTNASLCRFGDGEFEIMRGRERPWFQHADGDLGKRLYEVLRSQEEKIAIAIADDFGSLECYTEYAADNIRDYMSLETRAAIMGFLDMDRAYYDAYVSRPYILYKDKGAAAQKFELVKRLWDKKNVLLVEGASARMGVGNDLFANAARLWRILCPSREAYRSYAQILQAAQSQLARASVDLVLVSLGPAATVLAYDLAKSGAVALDIGQIDNEYEWYLRKAEKQCAIPGKMAAESGCMEEAAQAADGAYLSQVVKVVG